MLEFLGSRETLVPEVLLAYRVPLGTKDSRVPKDLQVCEATLAVLGKWECPEPPASQAHLVPLDCWDPRVSRAPEGAEDKRVTVVKWACRAERFVARLHKYGIMLAFSGRPRREGRGRY